MARTCLCTSRRFRERASRPSPRVSGSSSTSLAAPRACRRPTSARSNRPRYHLTQRGGAQAPPLRFWQEIGLERPRRAPVAADHLLCARSAATPDGAVAAPPYHLEIALSRP